jgi:lysine decarboxylase
LPAWSQAALVLARTDRIDPARLEAGVEATATTSPAGAILASTDAARALLERDGAALLGEAIAATHDARDRLRAVDGLTVLDGPGVDPLKLTLVLSGTGADGNAVEQELLAAGLPVESADRDVIVAVVSLADSPGPDGTVARLADAIARSVEAGRGAPRPATPPAVYGVEPVPAVPPRCAFFATTETVHREEAVGRVSAELVAPYPPGIPVLSPGELVTCEALAALSQARESGVRIAYAADPSLRTVRVLAGGTNPVAVRT